FLTIEIAVYGVGAIGSVVAKDLNQMGFKVNGWSRTEKVIKGVTCYHGESGFSKLIKTCDIHICLLPLTFSTRNIFNNITFKNMKYGSCFINAGRGDHVVDEDLLENCKSGQISNAILDVYKNEPLPKNHNFWEQKNIRLWPHVSAETNPETAAKQIANAIKCINNNISPPNTINRNLGY
ncbi:NAD(P)-binding domain-containing protein, partial [Alphaproteobacteria bacterium]|nr:NAD(P)-binding domain-containing protein [Alphaproteobacteria bacterium]